MIDTGVLWTPILHAEASVLECLLSTPESTAALNAARHLQAAKGSVAEFEALALYQLAAQYNRPGAHILELGTKYGWTAAIMAQAAPLAIVVTVNAAEHEWRNNVRDLTPWPNVWPAHAVSWDWIADLAAYPGPTDQIALAFVDADHQRVANDMPVWNHIAVGGMAIFHDDNFYSSPPVAECLDRLAALLGRPRDVQITDPDRWGRGLSGFVKRAGDPDWVAE